MQETLRRRAPKKIIMKLHINWGHSSAARNKRVLVGAEGDAQSLIRRVDDVAPLRDACKAFAKAPRIPISGTLSDSMPNGRVLSDDVVALHIMDVFSKYSILTRVRPKYPQKMPFCPAGGGLWRPQKFASG